MLVMFTWKNKKRESEHQQRNPHNTQTSLNYCSNLGLSTDMEFRFMGKRDTFMLLVSSIHLHGNIYSKFNIIFNTSMLNYT